ncbi:hypothetical protein TVAG_132890 [Trichomonas vaginalis G3]|uniref:Uncharacterized protein n=1 Tax=Trichomonas vaginalis (strain ATCC PRA-98 / G3) TaxID=412133 RepID=A2G3I1_TRIV3|nr:hypothetical protein TVAGG3_0972660 [Trichomonas vaginalis G3]EAX88284.1 hypothetical protein TVAG_132890 [Trichomonas vaginalis G3]KAI5488701.1 hypothetical protein TVAGG3_0972660 [Trichomonas vaginalis G3]|eukprot:XP_001301214.1 hypothetical protein [Trichomonas vaginalis G3]
MNYDSPELAHLSPNERECFIKETLQKKRVQRIIEARKQASEMTRNIQKKYKQSKEEFDQKHKNKKTAEELAPLKKQIEDLQARIEYNENNRRKAYIDAIENENNNQQKQEAEKLLTMQRQKDAIERYNEGLIYMRDNDPNIPIKMRQNRIIAAKEESNRVQDIYVSKRKKFVEEMDKAEKAREQNEKNDYNDKMHPKLSIEDYSKTHMHAGIGIIPVNKEADKYKQELEEHERQEKENEKMRFESKRRRTREALNDVKFEDEVAMLENELRQIEQHEVDAALKSIADGTSKVRDQYCFAEKRIMRQEKMKKTWLAVDDEPKPRGPAPQPEPYRPPSPTSSYSSFTASLQ